MQGAYALGAYLRDSMIIHRPADGVINYNTCSFLIHVIYGLGIETLPRILHNSASLLLGYLLVECDNILSRLYDLFTTLATEFDIVMIIRLSQ